MRVYSPPVGSHAGTVRVGETDGGGATLVVSLPFLDETDDVDGATGGLAARVDREARADSGVPAASGPQSGSADAE